MAQDFTAYQAFIRRVLQDDAHQWESDPELVRRKANAIANRIFDQKSDGGNTIVSSSVEGTAFTFRVDGAFDADALVKYATRFLAYIEQLNPKDNDAKWLTRSAEDKAELNRRAIKVCRGLLKRNTRSGMNYSSIPL